MRWQIGLIVLLGFALRAATLIVPHTYFADEIFQYLETAHRLVFGPGVVTWEWRYGVRSWLFPLLLAGPMWEGGVIAPASALYLVLPKLALLVSSLGTIAAGWIIGRHLSLRHGLLAAFVAATWFEPVYFSTQALTEAAAVPLFLLGAALFMTADRRPAALVASGLLATAALLRFQYAPGIALFALIEARHDPRRLATLAAGALAVALFAAAIDTAMGQRPFGWVFENVHQNIGLARSHAWVSGPTFYLEAMAALFGVWTAPLALLALIGARRYPALAASAVCTIVLHSLIAHKEYRYILLPTTTLALLAAIGSADLLGRLARRLPADAMLRLWIAAGAAWGMASASLAAGPVVRPWSWHGTSNLEAFAALRDGGPLCGVALFDTRWTSSGGYAYLHRAVPLLAYDGGERDALVREQARFDAIVLPRPDPIPGGFALDRCFTGIAGTRAVCVARRPGPCTRAGSSHEINRLLRSEDR